MLNRFILVRLKTTLKKKRKLGDNFKIHFFKVTYSDVLRGFEHQISRYKNKRSVTGSTGPRAWISLDSGGLESWKEVDIGRLLLSRLVNVRINIKTGILSSDYEVSSDLRVGLRDTSPSVHIQVMMCTRSRGSFATGKRPILDWPVSSPHPYLSAPCPSRPPPTYESLLLLFVGQWKRIGLLNSCLRFESDHGWWMIWRMIGQDDP